MKTAFLVALFLGVSLTTGCVKSASEASVKSDGSATVKLSARYLCASIDKMKAVPDDCTCWKVYQIHDLTVPAARRALDAFTSSFDARTLTDRWSRLGLKVTKASVCEDDGWKVIDIEASTSSISDYNARLASELRAAAKGDYLTLLPWYLHTRKLLPRLPRFVKTADPAIVKAIIPVADVGSELGALAELSEDERTTLSKQLTYMKALRTFKHGSLKVRVKLPGTILMVDNAKQEGTDGVVFEIDGENVDPETISTQARAKGLITVTLRVDPKTFTIPLADG